MKATEQNVPVLLYKAVLIFESVDQMDEILKCDHLNESY